MKYHTLDSLANLAGIKNVTEDMFQMARAIKNLKRTSTVVYKFSSNEAFMSHKNHADRIGTFLQLMINNGFTESRRSICLNIKVRFDDKVQIQFDDKNAVLITVVMVPSMVSLEPDVVKAE